MTDDFSLVATLALGVSSGTKRCGITCSDATAAQLIIVQLFKDIAIKSRGALHMVKNVSFVLIFG